MTERLDDERRKIEDDERAARLAKEDAERKALLAEREREWAIERERYEKSGAIATLRGFVQRFGRRPEFKGVVAAINHYFDEHPCD